MKKIKIFMMISTILLLAGCGKNDSSSYVDVQKKIMDMESYTADTTVKYISNKGENEYEIRQSAKKDGKYIIETLAPENTKGHIILFDGQMVWQYNKNVESKISVGDKDKLERREISIFAFLENHLKSSDVSVETASTKEGVYTVLEAKIPKKNKYMDTEKLWINNETKMPEKLIIYDEDKKERVLVTYKKFEYNPKLSDSIFSIENIANTSEK